MIRKLSILVLLVFCLNSMNVFAVNEIDLVKSALQDINNVQTKTLAKFKDIKVQDWFTRWVSISYHAGLIAGYPDSTFKPNSDIIVEHFLIISLRALGIKPEQGFTMNYIGKAKEIGLVKDGEFDSYTRPITRGEMARILIRMVKGETYPDNLKDYSKLIADYDKIPDTFKEYALKAYFLGLMMGDELKRFNCNNTTTRAMACTVFIKYLDKDQRIKPSLVDPNTVPTVVTEEEYAKMQEEHYREVTANLRDDTWKLSDIEVQRLKGYKLSLMPGVDKVIGGETGKGKELTFDEYMQQFGIKEATMSVARGIGYLEAIHNIDYRNSKNAFLDAFRPFIYKFDLDSKVEKIYNAAQKYKSISESKVYSHPSLVYRDKSGFIRVRGVIRYKVTNCTDIEGRFGKGVKLNRWMEEDFDILLGTSVWGGLWDYYYAKIYSISDSPREVEGVDLK